MHVSLFIAFALTVVASARLYNVEVRGILLCKENRYLQVYLELCEHDIGYSDDILDWKFVPVNQRFEIKGNHSELFGINPYLRIRHNCQDIQEEVIVEFGKRTRDTSIDLDFVNLEEEGLKDLILNKYKKS
ncbi:unnamed protein product [Cylicocyclus nassatus]|uniref:Transthyretin-like family protein n=1 Tax=Cylicocyclus nassatus TaxID=53992 RepID=A0AA36MGU2_CYLNA|nr:unnamed protein product [Cylicocyclus nassatus]